MLTLDEKNIFAIHTAHGLSPEEISAESKKLSPFLEHIHRQQQDFYMDSVLDNEELLSKIESFADMARKKYKHFVLCGIGGSSLGPIALQNALATEEKLIILDNIDPDFLTEKVRSIDLSQTLFVIITKSGGTPETIAQYLFFEQRILNAGFLPKEHFVFLTDPEKGFLRKEAALKSVPSFEIPPKVGGRFSVLTSVGLLPAALLDIDIRALLLGARKMREYFLNTDANKNLPFRLATIQFLLSKKGKTQNVFYAYSQKLFRVADWQRQLLAESTGKRFSEDGKEIFAGITPIAALGATDQHSQNQLYFEGPNDKFFVFLSVEKFQNTLPIPDFEYLQNMDFATLLRIEKKGTEGALNEVNRPNITISLSEVNAENLGQLFFLFEGATAFLGAFLNINAFDQPGVELSKNITKELLQSP